MSCKCKFVRTLASGIVCAYLALVTVGCDESYDLSKLGGDVTIFQNGITLPVESEVAISLSELLTDSLTGDYIKVDEAGRYVLSISGAVDPVEFEIPKIAMEKVNPELASTHLDFMESIESDPTLSALLDATGYTGGALPDVEQLIVPENVIHAPIADATQPYSFTVDNMPKELLAIHNVKIHEGTFANLSLHAEGLPKDITHVTFEFILDPPHELIIEPVSEGVWKDTDGYFHILHDLPCVNGCLDDAVKFKVLSLDFNPPLEVNQNHQLNVESHFYYYGKIHINESFHLGGWVPQLDLNMGFVMDATEVDEVTATIQADIEAMELAQELDNLPEFLTNPDMQLDLQEIAMELNINNNIPLGVNADFMVESKFFDGSTSGKITSDEPLAIKPSSQQKLIITNVDTYTDGDVVLVPNLNDLIKKIPQSVAFTVVPYVPATELTLLLGNTYSIDLDYSLNVPVVLGKGVKLKYETSLDNIAEDLRNVTSYISHARVSGVFESTLPLNLHLTLYAVDKNGNIMDEVKVSNALDVNANRTSPFNLGLDILAEKATFDKLDKIILSVSGDAEQVGQLSSGQFLKIHNLALCLPEGVTVNLEQ